MPTSTPVPVGTVAGDLCIERIGTCDKCRQKDFSFPRHASSRSGGANRAFLLEENDAAHVRATQSGNPFDLFMMTASDVELAHFRETLVHEGNPALPRMLDGLLGSKASRRVLLASAGHRNLETSTSRKIRILTFFI
jgi:hypothetical protein